MADQNKTMVKDLTTGSVARQLLAFALPLFFANALQAVYNLVDMMVVGQLIGGAGMSAVSIGGDVLHLLTFLAMGFSSAGQVLIAQAVGAGRKDEQHKLIGTLFTFLFIVSILIAVLCYVIRTPLLGWLNTPSESYDYTMSYMVTCIAGLVFIYGYNIVSAILRGMGDSKRPFVFIAIAAILNTVLDLLFVGVFHLEVFGAALATVIGQAVSFIVSLIYLYRHRESFGFDFAPASFRIDGPALRRLLALGVPMAIQSASINLSKIVLTSWINAEGVVYSALSGIYNKTGMMMGVVSNSFTTAGSSMVGQNLGAERYDRVPKIIGYVSAFGLIFATSVSALVLAFPAAICELFTQDAAVLAESSLIIIP
ncbi:MAG: MATE family efflux transporter, partial [Lachnospiraceae bacterium]|nr:MATE family efflux transporter [Lachnospiraceae bacterium]